MDAGLHGHVIPKRRKFGKVVDEINHILCTHCKAYFQNNYISRHEKKCFANTEQNVTRRSHTLAKSLIYTACHKKYVKILNKMRLKDEVLLNMRGDLTAKTVMEDILIVSWGENLLKKTPAERSKYHISAKMRRCARFLLAMREVH